jgi:hypothetical protein
MLPETQFNGHPNVCDISCLPVIGGQFTTLGFSVSIMLRNYMSSPFTSNRKPNTRFFLDHGHPLMFLKKNHQINLWISLFPHTMFPICVCFVRVYCVCVY